MFRTRRFSGIGSLSRTNQFWGCSPLRNIVNPFTIEADSRSKFQSFETDEPVTTRQDRLQKVSHFALSAIGWFSKSD